MATSSDGMAMNFDGSATSTLQVQNIDFVSSGSTDLSKFTTFEEYNNKYCDLLRTRLSEYEAFLERDGSLALQQSPQDIFAFKFNEHHSRGFHRGGPSLVTQDANAQQDVEHPVSWVDTIIALNEGKFQSYQTDGSSRDTIKGKEVEISEYERMMLEPLNKMQFPSEKDIEREYKARIETCKDLRELRASHMKVLGDLWHLENRLMRDCDVLAAHCKPETVAQLKLPAQAMTLETSFQGHSQLINDPENNVHISNDLIPTAPVTPSIIIPNIAPAVEGQPPPTGIANETVNRLSSPSPVPSSIPSPPHRTAEDPDWGPNANRNLEHTTPINMLSSTRKRAAAVIKQEYSLEKKKHKRIRKNQTEEEREHGPEFVKNMFDQQLTMTEMVPKYETRFGLHRSVDWIRKFHTRAEERRSSGISLASPSVPQQSSPQTVQDQSQATRARSTSNYSPPPASSFPETAPPPEHNGGFTPANRPFTSVQSPEMNGGGFTPTNTFIPIAPQNAPQNAPQTPQQ